MTSGSSSPLKQLRFGVGFADNQHPCFISSLQLFAAATDLKVSVMGFITFCKLANYVELQELESLAKDVL